MASNGQMHWWFGMDLSSLPFSHHATPGSASQAVLVLPYLVLIGAAMFLQYYQMKQMNSRNPQAAAANPQMQTDAEVFPYYFRCHLPKSARRSNHLHGRLFGHADRDTGIHVPAAAW